MEETANSIKIYINESVDIAVAEGLKRRGVQALSAKDTGNLGLTDEEQIQYASREEAAIFTKPCRESHAACCGDESAGFGPALT